MKEAAIKGLNYEPLYKIGLRFTTQFWRTAQDGLQPVQCGGQSTTDLPSRWIIYPSYGNNSPVNSPGVLLLYAWNTDAAAFVHLSDEERIDIALQDLQTVYPNVPIRKMFTGEAKSVNWVERWCTGDALYLPGQFKLLFEHGRSEAPGGFHFAGEHLSPFHTWIAGAIHSSIYVVEQITGGKPFRHLGWQHASPAHAYAPDDAHQAAEALADQIR
eukprot:Phypoly_transcript_18144.p1 GENE.Phypoly_transcript_18144~~Phypoly_transcript_18144.p1  ORF type:complete len:232 (+),score=26.74 Phypoly_transcript_18144:52-696(+)